MAGLTRLHQVFFLYAALFICPSAWSLPLWEVEGATNRIQLLGSIHVLRDTDYPLPEAMIDAYREADVIVLELVIDRIPAEEMQRVATELAIDPRGKSLRDLVGAGAYKEAVSLASAINIDLNMMQPFEPWFAAVQITQLRLMQLGFDSANGLESTTTLRARKDGKPIVGLETLGEQLGTLDTLPARAQRQFLVQTLEDAASIGDDLDRIVSAWRAGDADSLETLLLRDLGDHPEIYQQVLVGRNRNWTKKIIDMMDDEEDYLIIVGTMHLIGDDSVQSMLGEAGVRTRQIR